MVLWTFSSYRKRPPILIHSYAHCQSQGILLLSIWSYLGTCSLSCMVSFVVFTLFGFFLGFQTVQGGLIDLYIWRSWPIYCNYHVKVHVSLFIQWPLLQPNPNLLPRDRTPLLRHHYRLLDHHSSREVSTHPSITVQVQRPSEG